MGKFSRLGNDLYGGRKSIDFISKRALWYALSTVLVVAALLVVFVKGLNFGIEFTGGTQYRVPVAAAQADQATADELREAISGAGIDGVESPTVTTAGESLLVQIEEVPAATSDQVVAVIEDTVSTTGEISQDEISASWGKEVGQRAALGVGVFLVLVMLFIGFYFREWKMSVAALVALAHDIVITIGVYALSGFPVTPAAVTGLLAILGFSLYDTVVVFDKVKENTHAMARNRQTYAQAANLAVNQTLVRSINTGIVALIPIGAILFTSTVLLGASSLKDLALSQFVGMAVGVYSSIFLAPRVLVHLKSNETEVVLAERRAKARARAAADKYAAVPAFTEDMAIQDDPDTLRERGAILVDDEYDDDEVDERPTRGTGPTTERASDAVGRGRTVPTNQRPVGESRASGRQQPSRAPKSKRK